MESIKSSFDRLIGLLKSKEGLIFLAVVFVFFALVLKFLKPRWIMNKIGLVRTRTRRVRTYMRGRTRYVRSRFRRRRR